MKLAYETNLWGQIYGAGSGVTSIGDLFYQTTASISDALRDIADGGFEGFEIFDGDLLNLKNQGNDLQRLIKENGLRLVGVYSGANLIFPDILTEELLRLEEAASVAQELGAIHFVLGGGAVRRNGIREEDYILLGKGLDKVAEIAERYNLIPSYHPHLGTISESPDQLEKIFSNSGINFCPDTAHQSAGGCDPAETIRKYADRIKYVHLKDLRKEPFSFMPLGEGELDFKSIMSVLDEMDYDGWITVELDGYAGDLKQAVKTCRNFFSGY